MTRPWRREPRPLRDEDLNTEKLMQELEDFLRDEREGGAG